MPTTDRAAVALLGGLPGPANLGARLFLACFDLGLGCVLNVFGSRVMEVAVVVVVAGNRVGGAREIWVLPAGAEVGKLMGGL